MSCHVASYNVLYIIHFVSWYCVCYATLCQDVWQWLLCFRPWWHSGTWHLSLGSKLAAPPFSRRGGQRRATREALALLLVVQGAALHAGPDLASRAEACAMTPYIALYHINTYHVNAKGNAPKYLHWCMYTCITQCSARLGYAISMPVPMLMLTLTLMLMLVLTCYASLCYPMLWYSSLRYATLCYATIPCATLRSLCSAMPCHATTCLSWSVWMFLSPSASPSQVPARTSARWSRPTPMRPLNASNKAADLAQTSLIKMVEAELSEANQLGNSPCTNLLLRHPCQSVDMDMISLSQW